MLAPNPDISGPVPGPIARIAYRLVDVLKSVGYAVDTELWGRHQREEGPVRKVVGRAADLLRIRRRISRGSYDLVFVHTTHDWRALCRDLLLVLPSAANVRWVLLFHGSRSDRLVRPGRRLFKLATRSLLRRTAAVLLLSSEEVMEWGRFYQRGNYYQVANAFMPLNQEGPEPSDVTHSRGLPEILFVGRLTREKGLYELVEAFATVRARRECRLRVVGEGPEAARLQALSSELGVAGDVEFTGYLPESELSHVYQEADIFVLPSHSEGLPTVLLEAMSFGLAVVTTDIRGATDYLIEGENVLFVPPRRPDALAEALLRLLGDEGLRRAQGENNVRRVEDFAPSRVVVAYERVFDQVLGRTPIAKGDLGSTFGEEGL
jgi:glycosyltransferase involved in cell wall biosynthesis